MLIYPAMRYLLMLYKTNDFIIEGEMLYLFFRLCDFVSILFSYLNRPVEEAIQRLLFYL